MSRRRKVLIGVVAAIGFGLAFVVLHDLVLYRTMSVLPNEYCRVSTDSASERKLESGELTTNEADSGCRQGEVHLCSYQRFVLGEVIEVKSQPC